VKRFSFVTHADLLGLYVGAEFRMEMLDDLLSHKLYSDNEITLSAFYLRGWKFYLQQTSRVAARDLAKGLAQGKSRIL
jgi:hypothetical protein